ncbi:MAG: cyclic nucleotide-binding domain-containing protein [Acidimicrobiales bacterium]|jgi:CRP-like cAMP-binding protein|nr:cyclic nucleotide-binding domain-containing protein [Acidimicrobiales bacterium]
MSDSSSTQIAAEVTTYLPRVGMFSQCNTSELRVIARHLEIREVATDAVVVADGEEGDELFLVLSGRVEARRGGQARLSFGPGDHFGELSVLDPAPRSADVVATEPSVLGVLSRSKLGLVFTGIPSVAPKMLSGLARSLRELIQADAPVE